MSPEKKSKRRRSATPAAERKAKSSRTPKRTTADNECTVPEPVPSRALPSLKVRPDPEHEQRAIRDYVERQARDERVVHLEKVASERVFGTKHDVWDVHTNRCRWWVVTSPANLYRQKDFPSLDYILSFHVGLMARVAARQEGQVSDRAADRDRLLAPWRRWEQATEALDLAEEAEDFQAVGMRCRECLLELVQAIVQPGMLELGEEAPKRGDFIHWSEIIARAIASGASAHEVRSFLKVSAKATWQLVNWLTHGRNAVRNDGQVAVDATASVLAAFTTSLMRHEHGTPDRCPACSSYQMGLDHRVSSAPALPLRTFAVCARCGWEAETKTDDRQAHAAESVSEPEPA